MLSEAPTVRLSLVSRWPSRPSQRLGFLQALACTCTGCFKRLLGPWGVGGVLLITLNQDLGREARQGVEQIPQCRGDSGANSALPTPKGPHQQSPHRDLHLLWELFGDLSASHLPSGLFLP